MVEYEKQKGLDGRREDLGSNEDLISLVYRNGDDRSASERYRHGHTHITV